MWLFLLGALAAAALAVSLFLTYTGSQRRHKLMTAAAHVSGLGFEALQRLFGPETGGLPAFLRQPDAHQSAFVNEALAVIWSHVDRAAGKWAFSNKNLETLLNSSTFWKPAWMARSGVVLQAMELGDVPPKITGIKVYRPPTADGARPDALIIDVGFDWASKMHCSMVMKALPRPSALTARPSFLDAALALFYRAVAVKVTVKNLVARGQLRVVAAPLLGELPVVGALRLSFLSAPAVAYDLSTLGANPLMVPGLESFVNSFIANQVLQPFIFPQGFVLDVAALLGGVAGPPPVAKPQGVLSVTVHGADNVPRMDLFGGADPYVKCFLAGKVKVRTSVRSNTRTPRWEETFQLVVHDVSHQTLTLELWDSDSLRPDDLVGRVELAPLGDWVGAHNAPVPLTLKVSRAVGGKGRRTAPQYSDGDGGAALGEEAKHDVGAAASSGPEITEVNARGGAQASSDRKGPGVGASLSSLGRRRDCTLRVTLQFFKFSSQEASAAVDAQRGLRPRLSTVSPRLRRLLGGGMLYVHLERAEGLSTHVGVTKAFKVKVKVGPRGGVALYKRIAERTGMGRGLDARAPVFSEDIDILVDGAAATATDTVVSVEIWVTHLLRRPSFKGAVAVPLARVLAAGRLRDSWVLQGGQGRLEMGLEWHGLMESM